LEETKREFDELSSWQKASNTAITKLRADKQKLEEEAKLFAQFIEKQMGIIGGLEEEADRPSPNVRNSYNLRCRCIWTDKQRLMPRLTLQRRH
jgi:hypothetical protein